MLTKARKRLVKKLWDNRCAFCNEKTQLTIDHIQPAVCGGASRLFNLRPLCSACHRRLQPTQKERWRRACLHVFVETKRLWLDSGKVQLTSSKVCVFCGGYSD